MSDTVYYLFVLLCCSITKTHADTARYYYDYECNEPLVASSKLSATSSLRDRGPDNAKLNDIAPLSSPSTKPETEEVVTGFIHLQVRSYKTRTLNLYHKIHQAPEAMDSINVRWAFNADAWQPTYEEILLASSYIQTEEKLRISKFVFQNDAKSSLIGRLMLRKFVHFATSMTYNEIQFGRDSHGKPILLGTENTSLSFNVSHQGAYVVLAGNSTYKIGIDVMKIEPPAGKNVPEFFRLMTRQFSTHEWSTVKDFPTEMEQIACFYRFWCLKESYVKNTGFGLTVPLNQISFHVNTRDLEVGKFVTDTVLIQNNVLKKDWVFEETLLDEKYATAVSLQIKDRSNYKPVPYIFVTFEDLVEGGRPLQDADSNFSVDFMKKALKHF